MQINLNPTSERGASRDAVNRPRETLGDSHLISSDPRSRFGLVCDLLCCRGNIILSEQGEGRALRPSADRQSRLKPLESGASGRERMVNGWAARVGGELIEFSAEIAWFGDILK